MITYITLFVGLDDSGHAHSEVLYAGASKEDAISRLREEENTIFYGEDTHSSIEVRRFPEDESEDLPRLSVDDDPAPEHLPEGYDHGMVWYDSEKQQSGTWHLLGDNDEVIDIFEGKLERYVEARIRAGERIVKVG